MQVGGVLIRALLVALAAGALMAAPADADLSFRPAYTDSATAPVTTPIYVTAPSGDSTRLFVVERGGRIRVAVGGTILEAPFLDISSRIQTTGEGGLLSMAFAPDYGTSGKFYVYFVQKSDGHIRVEQFTRSGANPNVADQVTPPVMMLDVAHPTYTNHYGGQLAFGPDGLLYAGTGDGGGSGDPGANAQNAASKLGKLLAIDTTTATVTTAALGLRNPFRFSFDRTTGDLVLGDVGQDLWEEIDWVPATDTLTGSNFGWNCWEANNHRVPACNPASYVSPVIAYPNPNGVSSPPAAVTGGVVVRDPALTSLVGRYLYADFFAGAIHSAQLATPVTDDRTEDVLPVVSQLVAFGEDADGHVYVVSLAGSVQRIVETPDPAAGGTSPPGPDPTPITGSTPASGTGGPGGQPSAAGVKDVTAPLLRIRAARAQDALHRHVVRVSVACDEACVVRAAGRARGLALRGVLERLGAGKRGLFQLRLSVRARRALALRGVVTVSLRARDAARNLRTASLTVRVRR
jgi:glucose/arabinose dehydrogenase